MDSIHEIEGARQLVTYPAVADECCPQLGSAATHHRARSRAGEEVTVPQRETGLLEVEDVGGGLEQGGLLTPLDGPVRVDDVDPITNCVKIGGSGVAADALRHHDAVVTAFEEARHFIDHVRLRRFRKPPCHDADPHSISLIQPSGYTMEQRSNEDPSGRSSYCSTQSLADAVDLGVRESGVDRH
jgi:hypothetical protein